MTALYRKVANGRAFRYVPYVAPSPALNDDMTEREIISAVANLAVLAINGYYVMLTPKTYVANRVRDVRESVLRMFAGTGVKIDDDTINFCTSVWNATMMQLSGKDQPGIEKISLAGVKS